MMLWGQVVYIALSIGVLRLVYGKRFSLSIALLTGLNIYELEETKTTERVKERRKKRRIQIGASNGLVQMQTQRQLVSSSVLYHYFDALVCLTALTVVHGVVYFLAPFVFRNGSLVFLPLAALAAGGSILVLIKVDVVSVYTPSYLKWSSLVIFGICFMVSSILFSCLPDQIFVFNLEDIAGDLSTRISGFLAKVAKDAKIEMMTEVEITVPMVHVGVSLMASFIGAGITQAAIQTTQSIQLQLHPLDQLRPYLALDHILKIIKHLQDLVLLINCSLPFTPLVENLSMTSSDLKRVQSGGLLLWSVCQMMLLRAIVRGYLSGGLVHWFDSIQLKKKKKQEANIVALKIHKFSLFLCKVAVEGLAPSVFLGSCGLLFLVGVESGNKLLEHLFGFLAWWMSLCWLIYSVFVIGISRISSVNIT